MTQKNLENLVTELNPLTQVKIYRSARAIILKKMDQKTISPEKAREMLEYVKKGLSAVKTAKDAKEFYVLVGLKFPELFELASYFETQGDEKIENVISEIADIFIQKNKMDLAAKIMNEMESKSDKKELLKNLEKDYPDEFAAAFEAVKKHTL